ncbi:hypothetical protein DX933_05425 [Ornithinibacillus gellani]|uniref:YkuS family protein n=1 Tax=Ornithinibacillus gellani TaxID=2293253 RepID=UPI000F47894B|nr:YkuS family protein [Ornithinibacillus gellani]TQS75715.1 hypothetical protein DX933_05425 [Ornithinibacillus gellani]
MAKIGVEPTLTAVKETLAEMGHEVIDLYSESDAQGCDCCIISGMDKDMMGISDVYTEGFVINAEGANAAQVAQLANEKLS